MTGQLLPAIEDVPEGWALIGGVQWCVTHNGLNDECGDNHVVTHHVTPAGGDLADVEVVVYEDCCDLADIEDDGSFTPCDLRTIAALPKTEDR